ncbi:hypothetical protein Tco_1122179 [Tanacetum coccineum]|uniref:Reverse transcriptase domain-containing protein n=1 Tax=Tanacetum coccineum TaxID=301880 RepID=A0ABQ5IZZ7_9ASTR
MSQSANQAQTSANSIVRNRAGKGSKQTPGSNSECLPTDKLRETCEKHYNQILPIMAEKVHQEKLQGIQTRLTYGESSHQNSQTQFSKLESCDRKKRPKRRRQSLVTTSRGTRSWRTASAFSRLKHERDKPTRRRSPVSATMFTRLGPRDKDVFTGMGEETDASTTMRPVGSSVHTGHASRKKVYSLIICTNRSAKNHSRRKKDARELIRSYVTCSSEHQHEIEEEWDATDYASRRPRTQDEEWELLATKEVHKRSCGNPSYQAKGRRANGSLHGKIQGREHACQRSTIMHEDIRIHARRMHPSQEADRRAWKLTNMTSVSRSIAEHRLNIREGCQPIRQKRRGQALKMNKAIQEEVTKLMEAEIMREVHYHDWLSNPIMVKKHDGSWRMCVDFTDLNKSCPKDCYPLLKIE